MFNPACAIGNLTDCSLLSQVGIGGVCYLSDVCTGILGQALLAVPVIHIFYMSKDNYKETNHKTTGRRPLANVPEPSRLGTLDA